MSSVPLISQQERNELINYLPSTIYNQLNHLIGLGLRAPQATRDKLRGIISTIHDMYHQGSFNDASFIEAENAVLQLDELSDTWVHRDAVQVFKEEFANWAANEYTDFLADHGTHSLREFM